MAVRVVLRRPCAADQSAFLEAVQRSRALHGPWVQAPATPRQFRAFLRRQKNPAQCGFLVCHPRTQALLGVINISEIVRGNFCSAYLGYYAFAGHERQGHMRAGLRAVIRHAFGALKLHRLEANIQPGNHASIALVRACGFDREGYSPRYLKVGGRWRDHERWATRAS